MTSLLAATLASVLTATPAILSIDADGKKSTVSYTCVHKLHKFTGVSHSLDGKAKILADGTVQVQITSPVGAFDSDNGNRDEHMKETVEAVKFPNVTVKCLAKITDNVSQQASANCEVSLHGQPQKVTVPVDLKFDGPTTVRASGKLTVTWDDFGIKRPQLLFVPIEPTGDVVFDVAFVKAN